MRTLRVRGTGDLLAFLPYHLGFHPRYSVVVVALHDGRMGVVARMDRPRPPGEGLDAVDLAAVAGTLERARPDDVVVVVYGQRHGMLDDADELVQTLSDHGIPVGEVLAVHDGRWWSLLCTDDTCCPEQGHEVPAAASVPAVLEYVGCGADPLPDRSGLTDLLLPDPDAPLEAAFTDARRAWASAGRGARRLALDAWQEVIAGTTDPRTRGFALAGLLDVQVRDMVLAALSPAVVPLCVLDEDSRADLAARGLPSGSEALEESLRRRALLAGLAREAPEAVRAPTLTVLAVYAWSVGDGAMSSVALEQATTADPWYALAGLVRRLLVLQVRPGELLTP